jgi:hypothetical protein
MERGWRYLLWFLLKAEKDKSLALWLDNHIGFSAKLVKLV